MQPASLKITSKHPVFSTNAGNSVMFPHSDGSGWTFGQWDIVRITQICREHFVETLKK